MLGTIVAVMLEDEATAVRVTVPVNPPDGVTVIVDVPWPPVVKVMLVGLAVSAKSTFDTTTVMVAVVWASEPLVPVTVTVYVPSTVALTNSWVLLTPPGPSIRIALPNEVVSPGEAFALNMMVPAKPFWLMTAIVVLHVAPVVQLTVTGELGVMVKSVTLSGKLPWLPL
jgi:hypothetical protein